jgi:hypothetical protein
MQLRFFIAPFSFLTAATGFLFAQPFATVNEYEMAIAKEFDKASHLSSDSFKIKAYNDIEELLSEALLLPAAFSYPFDSLKQLGRITSRDDKVRVFTWDLLLNDGSHRYYGFFLCRSKNPEHSQVIRLICNTADISDPGDQVLGPDSWFGALYYEIIDGKWNDHPIYTLLGYDPNNIFISRKIIDCFYLKDDTIPVLGAPIFMINNKVRERVLFEYSARVSMNLRYDTQQKMIVFDHLSPAKPSYTGDFEFYGPDFSYDAFKFMDNYWVLQENIDFRNHK